MTKQTLLIRKLYTLEMERWFSANKLPKHSFQRQIFIAQYNAFSLAKDLAILCFKGDLDQFEPVEDLLTWKEPKRKKKNHIE